ncbi:LuxR C-terminal-related transcriptional regulator [Mariniluteicoccus flavus]
MHATSTPSAPVVQDPNGLWMVQRPRLLKRLDEATQRPVTLLVAPIGYGKRTLLDQWAASRRERVRRVNGAALTPQEARAAVGVRKDALAPLIVVDDAHLASSETLDALLDLLDHDVRLVLSGIARPHLAVGGLAARGQVTEFTAPDIAFTRDEARALLETAAPLPDHALDVVMSTSLGWPAAVRILAEQELSWDRETSQLERLYAFFAEEVHPLLSPAELALVRAVAILPSVTPTVTHAFTGDREAHQTLTSLVARGFPMARNGTTLTLHPLVRRQLLEELVASDPDHHAQLSARGIDWLVASGEPLAAVQLALDSGQNDDVGDLLRRHFVHHMFTDADRLRPLVDACGATGQLAPWETAMMQACLLAASGTVASHLALATVEALVPDGLTPLDRLRLASFQLFVARQRAYAGFDAAAAIAAIDPADAASLPREGLGHLAFWQVERGLHLLHTGDLTAAHQWLVEGLTTARLSDLQPVAIQALAGRAWIAARRGGVTATRRLADEAIMEVSSLRLGAPCALAELAWLAHACVDIDLADFERAEHHLDGYRRCSLSPRRETAVLAAHLEALLHLMKNDVRATERIIRRARTTIADLLPAEDFILTGTVLGAHLIADDRDAAAVELDHIDDIARPEFGGVEHFHAHHLMRLDQFDEAFALLDPLVRAGEVVIEKEWLQMLMAYALAADRSGRPGTAVATFAAADELASRLGMDDPRARQNLGTVERRARVQFTEAEMHLLRNLRAAESIGELAERLFVSPNTVKTHLRRIYKKLSVSSRADAIERARVLRLL